ncbi:unnamed protein product [Sympodiomycopsis kandeliae]
MRHNRRQDSGHIFVCTKPTDQHQEGLVFHIVLKQTSIKPLSTYFKMAGGDFHPIKTDPAIERWHDMHATMYQRFKPTRHNIRPILGLGLVFPAVMYYVSYYTDGIWDMRGTSRDERFVRVPGSKHSSAAAALQRQREQASQEPAEEE